MNMPSISISHFNPGQLPEDDFLANFIARQPTFDYFMRELRNTANGQAARHHLVIAPRGYGKTSLLRRIQIALRNDPEFNTRYIALAFREEQHNVISLDLFWRNCLQSLLEAREDEGADEAEIDALDRLWLQHAPRMGLKRDQQDGAPAWEAFNAECQRLGRRPVLLIDNLDTLLIGLEHHQWGLRTILQLADGPVLIAAASRYPEQLADRDAAFFDFFRITTLQRLSDREVMDCLRTLADRRGAWGEPVRQLLTNDPGRISALNTMAGGNPRTLSVLYTVLEAHMSDDVLKQLSAMLDTFTGWYQARTEELPVQTRAVFDALALNWNPMTAAELAAVSGQETVAVSSHLSRLEKAGYVEAVALSHTRKTRNGYQVAERFYGIWYLMRNGPRRTRHTIRWLTEFLSACFSRSELNRMARDKLQMPSDSIESMLALAQSLNHKALRTRLLEKAASQIGGGDEAADLRGLVEELRCQPVAGNARRAKSKRAKGKADDVVLTPQERLVELERAVAANPDDAESWRALGKLNLDVNEYGRSEQALRRAISLNERDEEAWFWLGLTLHTGLGQYTEAERAYRTSLALQDTAITWYALAVLLHRGTMQYAEAEAAYRRALALDDTEAHIWANFADLLKHDPDHRDEAAMAYRKAISLNAKDARTWVQFGRFLYFYAQRYEEVEECYRKALALDDKASNTWYCLGFFLCMQSGRSDEAEIAFHKAIELDASSHRAWSALGMLLHSKGDEDEAAESAYRKAIALHDDSLTWFSLGKLLNRLGRHTEAEAAFRTSIAIDNGSAMVWANLADLLRCDLEQFESADEAYRQAIQLDGQDIHAWTGLCLLQHHCLGQYDLALQAYIQVLQIEPGNKEMHGQLVHLLALNLGQREVAIEHADRVRSALSPLETLLVDAALAWSDTQPVASALGWQKLHEAVALRDNSLWSDHIAALQNILAYAVVKGDGEHVLRWMEDANYPDHYAPLYHAFCALLVGEDHLLAINPEMGGVAKDIYKGLARMRSLLEQHRLRSPEGGKRVRRARS
ncbi:MAG: tetratricopeptide repeat protein [Burkholderiales bacterium]|nr:tetratricopeptide repeat protein [Burkholderiales bacterium]